MSEKISILGLKVDKITMQEALKRFEEMLQNEGLKFIVTPNSEILEAATKNDELKEIINEADMVIPDGIGLVYASKIKGQPLRERVTGIDFSFNALHVIKDLGKKAYFLGGKPGIAEAAAENMQKQIEGLCICGTHDGYFKAEEENALVEEINNLNPDFLLVALGAPKQEKFIFKYKDKLNCKVAIGIGGSLDVWSGASKRAPEFYQKHGLEWLYRLKSEPERIGRVARIPVFLAKVLFDK